MKVYAMQMSRPSHGSEMHIEMVVSSSSGDD